MEVYEEMLRRVLFTILIPTVMIGLALPLPGASGDYYYNRDYGWRIEIPSAFEIDDSSAPKTLAFSVGDSGSVTIESGLPSEFFWDMDSAASSIMRIMSFAADHVQIITMEPGESETNLLFNDIYYRVETGEEWLYGFLRMYSGPNGIILCYRDGQKRFERNIDRVQKFADLLYFPTLDEMFGEGDFELEQFTNPVYGYRISYPSILTNDEVWSYVSLRFLYESIIDIYGATKLEPDPQKVIQDSRQLVLDSLEEYQYEILDEVEGTTDGGFPYLDIKITDNDSPPWLKRARIYALPKTVVRLEYYWPMDQLDTRDAIFTQVVDTFEYDPQWITEEASDYYTIPVEEVYEYGEFVWVEYEDEQYAFTINVPDFLEWECAEGVVFFNYNYIPIITVVIEAYPGFNRDEALSAGVGSAEAEIALMWDYTRYGDATGIMPGGEPYVDFYMDDGDPEGAWVKHVRVIGLEELAIRIEMYRPIHQTGLLNMLFADVVESLRFSPV